MNSPVIFPIKMIARFQRSSDTPVYLQLAYNIINAVQSRLIAGGTRLPGTRTMSTMLKVHRKTVIAAYEELYQQGWLIVKPNKGSYIKYPQKANQEFSRNHLLLTSYPSQTVFTVYKNNLLDIPMEPNGLPWSLTDGVPDTRLFPVNKLGMDFTTLLRRRGFHKKQAISSVSGNHFFRSQLANFLNISRQLYIKDNNLLVARSMEMCLYIIASLLLKKSDLVITGAPGNHKANMVFQQAGAVIKTVPVDDDGLDVDAIQRICKKYVVRMVYVDSHCHYPTTAILSAERRAKLLKLAQQHGFIIVENDHEYDFCFRKSAPFPIAAMDNSGTVVYMGTFGRSMPQGFRKGFVIAPENLIHEAKKFLSLLDMPADWLSEQVLGEWINAGEISRFLKKEQQEYYQRRIYFCNRLKKEMGLYLQFRAPGAGLAVWTYWERGLNLLRISKTCAELGLHLPVALLYQTRSMSAIRLGFANFTNQETDDVLSILKEAVQQTGA